MESRNSFFKVMINENFARELQLPPAFVRLHAEILPVNAKLRTSSGETWNVKLEQTDDERYFFTRGWNKFVKYFGLELGEFVMFTLSGKSVFDVTVFGINGCDRKIDFSDSDPDEEQDVIEEEAGTISKSKSPLYFEILMKLHHGSRVPLRKKFLTTTGLINQENVVVEYVPSHSRHVVALDRIRGRIDMAKGWSSFRKLNGLEYGKIYSFEFKPSKNVILVKEVEWTGDAGGIVINGTEYKLDQCHWHIPAEHTFNGTSYDMEMHIVHTNSSGDNAVIGVLYKFGAPDPFLQQLYPHIISGDDNEEGTETDVGIVDPFDIHFDSKKYYRYNGSLTTSPFSENVVWTVIKKEYAQLVRKLCRQPAFQETLKRARELERLPNVANYFLERAVDIFKPNYIPSRNDIIYTEGFPKSLLYMDFSFPHDDDPDSENQQDSMQRYQLIRSPTKAFEDNYEWLEMSEDVRIVIFSVSLCDYDELVADANNGSLVNKMMLNKKLFENIIAHPCFHRTCFLLLLTKYDLFEEKLRESPLNQCDWFNEFHSRGEPFLITATMAFFHVSVMFKRLYTVGVFICE
ncbi:hypothetical protein RD792_016727 [Penstemon davidsonii]|uniref:Uncharacterized protein n=1 Tax=Penstemon davidsonii TaxID=160366 RepID=A0ABR0CM16_9LAMI|nr:hypothetical protein RD792_016727 [Penstemon davidsonii]